MCYLASIALFVSDVCSIAFWVLLELNLVCFIMWMFWVPNKQCNETRSLLAYLIIQSVCSTLFIMASQFHHSDVLTIFLILIKLGAFPFHKWMLKFSEKLSPLKLTVFMSAQKMPYFIFLSSQTNSVMLILLSSGALIMSFLMTKKKELKELLLLSGVYMNLWVLLIFFMEKPAAWAMFLVLYGMSNFYMLNSMSRSQSMKSVMALSFLMGMPLQMLFLAKLFLVYSNSLTYSMMVALWFASMLSLWGYLKTMVWILPKVSSEMKLGYKSIYLMIIFLSLALMF